eukprot:scaffold13221_cov63-Phaeocystis_antarctica.AAC.1
MRPALLIHAKQSNADITSMPFLYHESEERSLATDLAASLGASFREFAPSLFTSMLDEIIPSGQARGEVREAINHKRGRKHARAGTRAL